MAHVVSGPSSSSQYDNGAKFQQLVNDFIAECPHLAREYLELHNRPVSPTTVRDTAAEFMPQYLEQMACFLRDSEPPVSQAARDEAIGKALKKLLLDEHLGLAAQVLNHPDIGASKLVRNEIRRLAEYQIITALHEERLEEIVELGSAVDPLLFHEGPYGEAISEKVREYIDAGALKKIAALLDAPVQIPDVVIYSTRSDIEDAIVKHVRGRQPLREAYALSDMFLLSDFFSGDRFLGAVRNNVEKSLQDRDLMGACRLAREIIGFERIRPTLVEAATEAIRLARSQYQYLATDPTASQNTKLLETLNSTIWKTAAVFGLPRETVLGLPPPEDARRLYRLGRGSCRLVHPQNRRRDEE